MKRKSKEYKSNNGVMSVSRIRMIVKDCLMLFALSSILSLTSCSKVEPEEAPVIVEKQKTILLYMAANNNLSPDAAINIKKIMEGYIPEDDNLLIYSIPLDLGNYTILDTLPVLVQVKYDKNHNVVADTLYKFPYQNSSTKLALQRALNVTKTLAPAKEYGLILWSHGTGWLPPLYTLTGTVSQVPNNDFYSQVQQLSEARRDLYTNITPLRHHWQSRPGGVDPLAHIVKSFGGEVNVEMSIFDLEAALPDDMFFDFIAFDACLMGGIEVLYQLRNKCNYMIFSPAEILTDSFDYTTVVEDFFKANYAKATYDIYDYYNRQTGVKHFVTISAFKTEGVEELAKKAKEIFDAHRPEIQTLDLDKIQPYFRFDDHWYYDLVDFIKNLASASESSEFEAILSKLLVAKYTTGTLGDLEIDPLRFSGISCYINAPIDDQLDAYYRKYDWEKVANMIISTSGTEE